MLHKPTAPLVLVFWALTALANAVLLQTIAAIAVRFVRFLCNRKRNLLTSDHREIWRFVRRKLCRQPPVEFSARNRPVADKNSLAILVFDQALIPRCFGVPTTA